MTTERTSPPPSANGEGPGNTPSSGPDSTGQSLSRLVNDPSNPMANARLFHSVEYVDTDLTWLVFHNGQFRIWDGSSWPVLDEEVLRAEVRRFFEHAHFMARSRDGEMERKWFKPNKAKVAEIVDALRAVTIEPDRSLPSWLQPGIAIPPMEVLPMANGLLWVPHPVLLSPTAGFFNSWALPYDYVENPPEPERWLRFLDELFADDDEAVQLLQEMVGYLISGDTSLQKILLILGPMRSGKGTIGRVIRALLGDINVAGPTLSSLCTNFGLMPLVDKPVGLISDARLGKGKETAVAVERLLSISGEDPLTIDIKYKTPYTTKLPTRLVIMTNEPPSLADSSGALASRFLTLQLTESFLGREDPGLLNKLLEELPGILVWALEGRRRLFDRGYFIQPESGKSIIDDLVELSAPITAFVEERCLLGATERVVFADLYAEWVDFCDESNLDPGSNSKFGADLRSAYPQIKVVRGRSQPGVPRKREYIGIGLI